MPQLEDVLQNTLLRSCAYGQAKRRKTWWALTAAEAGFNVLDLDLEDGSSIGRMISPEARKRISVVKCHDQMKGAVASIFFATFLRGDRFIWDEQSYESIIFPNAATEGHSFFILDPRKLTSNDVVIIDSWTSNAISLMRQWFGENKIDITTAQQAANSNWDVYRWANALADWELSQLHALPCHVIMLGHANQYDKMKTTVDNHGKKVQVVESSRTQMFSVSNPHATKIGKTFSDIFYFEMFGNDVMIDTSSKPDRDGGSRIIPPGNYKFDDFSFKQVCQIAGIPLPVDAAPSEGWQWIGSKQELMAVTQVQAKPKKQLAIPSVGAQPAAMTSLLSKE